MVSHLHESGASSPGGGGAPSEESWVEQQILEANVILESLGNAKTVRNNNSSRFGKFVQVHFTPSLGISGASIVNYLLEKSRITQQAASERNYHIFYQLVLGASGQERERYRLHASANEYHYLNQSGCVEFAGIDDRQGFSDLKLALTVLKMSQGDLDSIFTIVSAVLLFGNITFSYDDAKEKNEITNADVVQCISDMLCVNAEDLQRALCFRKLLIRGETSLVPLKREQASDNRDSIAKFLYNSLFQFIVEVINRNTSPPSRARGEGSHFIGVLDIFGFENFACNSFEQLCINYTNEKLQQFFNQFIFKLEQEEYAKEGINWARVDFKDNQNVIEMIESKLGLLSLLDEECRFNESLEKGYPDVFIKPRTAKGCFGVRHYAGEVIYQIQGFLEKNKDNVQEEVLEMFHESELAFLKTMFGSGGGSGTGASNPELSVRGKSGLSEGSKGGTISAKKTTASSNFKGQLNALVTTLASATPHYVRCIKPNPQTRAFVFDPELVLAQLRYSGMLETIRIRKAGFPFRMPFATFVERFRCLVPPETPTTLDARVKGVLSVLPAEHAPNIQRGKSKVFMRTEAVSCRAELQGSG